MKVILKEKQPLSYKGIITWYDKGVEFEVLEEKTFPGFKDLFYKLKSVKWNIVLDGWNNSEDFEKVI